MPQQHELQLMLVNTLRKVYTKQTNVAMCRIIKLVPQDLENSSIARISLALDILIHSATEDMIPAVQARLHELMSHNSSVCVISKRALPLLNSFSGEKDRRYVVEFYWHFAHWLGTILNR